MNDRSTPEPDDPADSPALIPAGQARALLEVVASLSSEPELGGVLQRIVTAAARLVGARYAALGAIGPDGRVEQFLTEGITPELRTKLDTELKAGKSFAEAAQAAGVTVETLPAFSFAEPLKPEVKGGQQVMSASIDLTVGQLSEVLTVDGGRAIFRVEKRQPVDEAAFEKEKGKLAEQLSEFQVMSAFPLWLAERQKAANLHSKIEG